MPSPSEADLRRQLPPVDQVLQDARVEALVARQGRVRVLRALRDLLDEARALATAGEKARLEEALRTLAPRLEARLAAAAAPSLVRVINATGVVVHTNLGRAPLPRSAAERVVALAASYSNLEYDLAEGGRGNREAHAEARLSSLLGTEAVAVVNNCAAAVLLAVNTLAEGREVIVSRGELVEIGGSFRIPEILKKGGTRLREVGTTNRTRLADYRAAISPDTALILRVHPSNFRIVGFTEAPTLAELADLAHEAGLPLACDQGSGLLGLEPDLLPGEETVLGDLGAGADVLSFSGDKLLGGPQAGLLVGRRRPIEAMRKNPLYRALRVDKMTLCALDAVLLEHERGHATTTVPVLAMLAASAETMRARADAFALALAAEGSGYVSEVVEGSSAVGGGAAPTLSVPTWLVALSHLARRPATLAAALRAGNPPVIVRVAEDRMLVDLRTVDPQHEPSLREALGRAAMATEPAPPRD
jgi:L-seryl-tRNA(Ser) seleniumtransferase